MIRNYLFLSIFICFCLINIKAESINHDFLSKSKSKDKNKLNRNLMISEDEIADDNIDDRSDDNEQNYNNQKQRIITNSNSHEIGQNLNLIDSVTNSNNQLDELSPIENKCRLVGSKTNNDNIIICSKIPLFCRNVCDNYKRIDFDSDLKKITSFSFGSYQVKENLELNFKSNLERIDSDAFNGMVIDSDVELVINIGSKDYNYEYSDEETSISINSTDFEDDPIDDVENSFYVQNDETLNQLEYDIHVTSTKSTEMNKSNKQKRKKRDVINKSILKIQQNAFRGLKIKEGGSLLIKFKNLNYLQFNTGSLNGLKQASGSSFYITADNVNFVSFKQKCAQSWVPYSQDEFDNDDDVDDDKKNNATNFIYGVLFRINITNVNEVIIEKESFSKMKLLNSSTFQLLINKFKTVILGKSSFSEINQSKLANFELNLANGRYLKLGQDVFSNLAQAEKSKFLIYVHINESNICLKNSTFSNLKQMTNSTLRLTFLLNEKNDLVFNENSFVNINQETSSFIQIYVLRPNKILIEQFAITNLNQSKSSLFEIWVSKSLSNFTIKSNAFRNIRQQARSSIRFGFTYSSNGYFKQSPFTFVDFISDPMSQVVYDFTQGTKFYLKFPSRRVPRIMIPMGDYKKKSLEALAWKMYPNLGKTSRPDNINLEDYLLDEKDFCKIINIPYDVLVKLNRNTECSCSVYYLYRIARKYYADLNDLNWLLYTPECYRIEYLKSIKENHSNGNTTNVLDLVEEKCHFGKKIENCYIESVSIDDNHLIDNEKCDQDTFQDLEDLDYDKNLNLIEDSLVYSESSDSKNINLNNKTADMSYDDEDEYIKEEELNDKEVTSNNDSYEDIDYNNETSVIYGNYNLKDLKDYEENENDEDDADDDLIDEDENGLEEHNIDYKLDDENSINNNDPDINENDNNNIFNSSFGLILVGVASIVLVSIILIIVIVLRCNHSTNGFSVYYDEEQDDNEYNYNGYDNDNERQQETKDQNHSHQIYPKNDSVKKSSLFSFVSNFKDQYNYSKLDNNSNSTLCNESLDNEITNKYLIVSKSKRNDSLDSTVLNLENSINNQLVSGPILNIKTNPFCLINK